MRRAIETLATICLVAAVAVLGGVAGGAFAAYLLNELFGV